MQYKTIVLHLLEQRPEIHQRLARDRTLMATLDRYSVDLRDRHEAWKEDLCRPTPDGDPSRIASEAMELALAEVEARLLMEFPSEQDEPLTLDGAMEFVRRHTPPA
jgi:hypothetical protein